MSLEASRLWVFLFLGRAGGGGFGAEGEGEGVLAVQGLTFRMVLAVFWRVEIWKEWFRCSDSRPANAFPMAESWSTIMSWSLLILSRMISWVRRIVASKMIRRAEGSSREAESEMPPMTLARGELTKSLRVGCFGVE